MNLLNIDKITTNQKDIEKGQKIVAAIYMVTKHLSENDPIRHSLRQIAVSFFSPVSNDKNTLLKQLEILLGSAVLVGLISEKNSSVIIYEIKNFYKNEEFLFEEGTLGQLF